MMAHYVMIHHDRSIIAHYVKAHHGQSHIGALRHQQENKSRSVFTKKLQIRPNLKQPCMSELVKYVSIFEKST